jgi:hypothetical protein
MKPATSPAARDLGPHLALGARYDQGAAFVWSPEAWAVVACTDGGRLVSGWSLSPPSSPSI